MAEPKQYTSALDQLLPMLLAQNSSSTQTQTSTANTAPLQAVYDRASAPMDSKVMSDLIASIMQQASQQVPTLTAALANATGSRSSTNSPLALALNQQNNQAAQQAAAAVLAQQNAQNQTALQAANGIAGATRTVNTSQADRKGGNIDPMQGLLGGFLLNQADKRGWMDKIGNTVSNGFESVFNTDTSSVPAWGDMFSGVNTSSLGGIENASSGLQFDMPSMDFGGGGFDLGSFTEYLPDLSGAGDFLSNIGSSIGSFFGFADGGPIQTAGGKGIMGSRTNAIDAAEGAAVAGQDPNEAIRAVLAAALTPQPHQPVAMDPSIMGFMQYLLNAGPGIRRNMYADGGRIGHMGRVPHTRDEPDHHHMFADGGIVRNFNNMGGPRTRYGTGSLNFDSSTPTVGNSSGTTSTGLLEMAQRMLSTGQREAGTGTQSSSSSARGYTGNMTDQQFADLKATRDVFGGFAPGELSTMGKLAMFGLNPSIFGLLKLGFDGYRNNEITQNAVDFTKSLYNTPEQQAIADQQAFDNEEAAIIAMGGSSPRVTEERDPDGNTKITFEGRTYTEAAPGTQTPDSPTTSTDSFSSYMTGTGFGGSAGDGFADGGMVKGRGTGTSDSIRAKNRQAGGPDVWFSNDEFVIPADVVAVPGMREHFQYLLDAYHTPVRR